MGWVVITYFIRLTYFPVSQRSFWATLTTHKCAKSPIPLSKAHLEDEEHSHVEPHVSSHFRTCAGNSTGNGLTHRCCSFNVFPLWTDSRVRLDTPSPQTVCSGGQPQRSFKRKTNNNNCFLFKTLKCPTPSGSLSSSSIPSPPSTTHCKSLGTYTRANKQTSTALISENPSINNYNLVSKSTFITEQMLWPTSKSLQ